MRHPDAGGERGGGRAGLPRVRQRRGGDGRLSGGPLPLRAALRRAGVGERLPLLRQLRHRRVEPVDRPVPAVPAVRAVRQAAADGGVARRPQDGAAARRAQRPLSRRHRHDHESRARVAAAQGREGVRDRRRVAVRGDDRRGGRHHRRRADGDARRRDAAVEREVGGGGGELHARDVPRLHCRRPLPAVRAAARARRRLLPAHVQPAPRRAVRRRPAAEPAEAHRRRHGDDVRRGGRRGRRPRRPAVLAGEAHRVRDVEREDRVAHQLRGAERHPGRVEGRAGGDRRLPAGVRPAVRGDSERLGGCGGGGRRRAARVRPGAADVGRAVRGVGRRAVGGGARRDGRPHSGERQHARAADRAHAAALRLPAGGGTRGRTRPHHAPAPRRAAVRQHPPAVRSGRAHALRARRARVRRRRRRWHGARVAGAAAAARGRDAGRRLRRRLRAADAPGQSAGRHHQDVVGERFEGGERGGARDHPTPPPPLLAAPLHPAVAREQPAPEPARQPEEQPEAARQGEVDPPRQRHAAPGGGGAHRPPRHRHQRLLGAPALRQPADGIRRSRLDAPADPHAPRRPTARHAAAHVRQRRGDEERRGGGGGGGGETDAKRRDATTADE